MTVTIHILHSLLLFLITGTSTSNRVQGMFTKISEAIETDTRQLNYGVAIADVDHGEDSQFDFEIIIAGYSGNNIVLKYDNDTNTLRDITDLPAYSALRDVQGNAIGVCACDIDGDGKEEIYFLNTNQAYAGRATYGDVLLKWRNNRYENILADFVNRNLDAKTYAGRSVACIDRNGDGKYGIVLATYSWNSNGAFALLEVDDNDPHTDYEKGVLVIKNVAEEAGIKRSTGGRGVVVGPIFGDEGKLDMYFDNEGNQWLGNFGANFLFKNNGDGTFTDQAAATGTIDQGQHGRGVTVADLNRDGKVDMIVGNWNGNHRIFMQQSGEEVSFKNIATPEFEKPSPIRTVMAADFDNDGHTEIFFNNIVNGAANDNANRLFRIKSEGPGINPTIEKIDAGEALEPTGYGTGAAYVDMDHDGILELIISHGESNSQPMDLYKVNNAGNNSWIRFYIKSVCGAPARGASVKLQTNDGDQQMNIIDSGSGYLCQMEPVAHFGLGSLAPVKAIFGWPDGTVIEKELQKSDINKLHTITHPHSHLCGNTSVFEQQSRKSENIAASREVHEETQVRKDDSGHISSSGGDGYIQRRYDPSESDGHKPVVCLTLFVFATISLLFLG